MFKLIRAISVLLSYMKKNGEGYVPVKAAATATGFSESEVRIVLSGLRDIMGRLGCNQFSNGDYENGSTTAERGDLTCF